MRVGVLMRPSRFEDLKASGLLKPELSDSSHLQQHGHKTIKFLLIDPCKPHTGDDSYDILLHKVDLL